MRYYKIIQGNDVVGVGTMFLRWFATSRAFFYCEFENAQIVQDVLSERFYHVDWMSRPPEEASGFAQADVEFIDSVEYDELYALLDDGEEVPFEPDVEPEPVNPEPDEEPDQDERPMSVAEMRARIAELTELVNNESKPFTAKQTYYKDNLIVNGAHMYFADQVIIKGETVNPGINCSEISLEDILAGIQNQNKGE